MGGRGSGSLRSKAGGGIGLAPQQPVQVQQPTPQPQVQQPTYKVVESGEYAKFMKMTDDQKADAIMTLIKQDVPVFLADNAFQKLTYAIGMNDKPKLVTDAQLNTIKGQELFRTVNSSRDTKNQMVFDADTIARQITKGSVTRVSDSGGSFYGRGIYFANSYRDSTLYGNTNGNIKKSAVVRAKIDPKAKTLSYSTAKQKVSQEMQSGSKLGKALAKCDSYSRESVYALSKGYDILTSGHGYYNVLTRKSLVMSQDIKAVGSRW